MPTRAHFGEAFGRNRLTEQIIPSPPAAITIVEVVRRETNASHGVNGLASAKGSSPVPKNAASWSGFV